MKYKNYKLEELATIKYGKNQKKVISDNGHIPIYGTGGLMGYATEALYDKPSVLIGRKGTIEKVRYVTHPFWTVDTLFYTIIQDNIVLPHYLYYLMSLLDLKKFNEGTTIPSLRTETLNRIEFNVPELEYQSKVLSILEPIEEKIDTNNLINKNLEAQIDSLYTELFIRSANPKWKLGTVADLGTVIGGSTPSKKVDAYYTDHGIAWITPKDLSLDRSKFFYHGETDITNLGLSNSSATIMPPGTVLFSSRAPIGYIAIAANELCTNQGFKSVVPKKTIGTAFVYCFLKANLPTIENMASGSTFKEVSGSIMKSVPATIPDQESISHFNDFAKPRILEQKNLEAENRSLATIRDSLLPRLMSGELDISKIALSC
ncbi:MAG TPA: restriction endonuclease subunit S [Prevotella sp.]|nr:restriction endonuclease subunit S [Prevotella sp.]